jgi:cation diffusion facilitator family transporter
MNLTDRYRKARISIFVGIFGNFFLGLFKIIVGILGESTAIIVDGVHSVSDLLTSIVVWIGLRVGKKPPDKYHPYGHGDAEPIAGLIVAIILGILGFEFARHSLEEILSGIIYKPVPFVMIAVLVSLVAKYWMFDFVVKIGRKLDSPALISDAYHHKSDFFTSLVVLVGVAGAMFGLRILDPLVGILISLWIIKIGFDVGRKNIRHLMGEIPSEKILKQIKEIASNVGGVKGVHNIKVHYVGPNATVSIHIEVDKNLKISETHDIATKVEKGIKNRIDSVSMVIVHPEPV